MSLNQPIAPWLQGLWDELPFAAFPHAVLIYGQAGIGKYDFAIRLAQALLCECAEPNLSKPCQQCEACRWFATGNHPDFMALVPEIQRKNLPQAALEGVKRMPQFEPLKPAMMKPMRKLPIKKKSVLLRSLRRAALLALWGSGVTEVVIG